MSRFAKRDIPATEAAHFHCKYSFVALDGTLRLDGRDWKEQKLKALTRDDFTCQRCGRPFDLDYDAIDIHHRVHKSKGGSDNLENLVSVHRRCHEEEHGARNPRLKSLTLREDLQ